MLNLKEAYRYQNFLDRLMGEASGAMRERTNALDTTKLHKRKAANASAEDLEELVECPDQLCPADVLALMEKLSEERRMITAAISGAKRKLVEESNFDIDAAREYAKFVRYTADSLGYILRTKAGVTTATGQGYTFNSEGNQVPYVYEIEQTTKERFDRAKFKAAQKEMLKKADQLSAEIEKAQVDAIVEFEPAFDVNDSFEDIMTEQYSGRGALPSE